MTAIQHFDDHDIRTVDALHPLLRSEPMLKLIAAIAPSVQELEDTFWALFAERSLQDAVGDALDQWGELLDEARDGLTDGHYRRVLLVKARVNRSNGTINELVDILAQLVDADEDSVIYMPLYPAGFALEYLRQVQSPASLLARVRRLILDATPAGVGLGYIVEAKAGYFGFDDDPDAFGFDEGQLAELF